MSTSRLYISVIVPIYNTERYVRQCIDSVLSQEDVDFELILVDDGSKDSCIEIIKEYQHKHPRIIQSYFIHGKGPAEPRNYGLRRASGDYILFLDSDDYLPKGALKSLFNAAKTFPEVDFIKGNHRVLTSSGEVPTRFAESRAQYANKVLSSEFALKHIIGGHNIPCNILYKHKFLMKHKLSFRENLTYLEDGPFLMEFFSFDPKALYIADETYVYRLGAEGSVTNTSLNASKIRSLIDGAAVYDTLKYRFRKEGVIELLRMRTSYAVGALRGIAQLSESDSKDLFQYYLSKIDYIDARFVTGLDKLMTCFYNLFPNFTYRLLRIVDASNRVR